MDDPGAEAGLTTESVARRSYGKLVAFLAAQTRDVAVAEDVLSEAFASALSQWPDKGCPANPEAWLLTVARRKAVDGARRRRSGTTAIEHMRILGEGSRDDSSASEIPDHRLGLMFACANPAIEPAIRAPLILQVVLGLDAKAIGSAFLTSPAAMGKRLVRAKTKIREAGIPFAIPGREVLAERVDAVLDAIYAAFTESWSDLGTEVTHNLRDEALYLGQLVNELLPDQPEALGLAALMLHAEARRDARRDPHGAYVPFAEQDIALWRSPMIEEAEQLLRRAATLGAPGRFQIEAAIQSAHVDRRRTGRSNWPIVVLLYDALMLVSGSPVVGINRALAIAEIEGPAAALASLGDVASDGRLIDYQPYWAVRADLLARVSRYEEARQAYGLAIGLESDPAVRRFLQERQASVPHEPEAGRPRPDDQSRTA